MSKTRDPPIVPPAFRPTSVLALQESHRATNMSGPSFVFSMYAGGSWRRYIAEKTFGRQYSILETQWRIGCVWRSRRWVVGIDPMKERETVRTSRMSDNISCTSTVVEDISSRDPASHPHFLVFIITVPPRRTPNTFHIQSSQEGSGHSSALPNPHSFSAFLRRGPFQDFIL